MYIKKNNYKKTITQTVTKIVIKLFLFCLILLLFIKLILVFKTQKINFDLNFIKEFNLSNILTIDRLCNFLIIIVIPLFFLLLAIMKLINNINYQKNKIYEFKAIYNDDETECLEIGYFTNDNGEVQIEPFVRTTIEVPRVLPYFITNLSNAFESNENKKIEGIQHWNTSKVTNMNYMFANAKKFNQNLSKWNVKKVIHFTDFADSLSEQQKPKFRQK
ncbi:BspA family leucine-rich repeat surface protein [Mycoplasma capricolum subsp. capricolum]|uniref:BspA family leucine-rich repeat surface protein n=1 Tax=Mycoplasma capricolum TaxID=2095 RepID=UPI003DA28661